jgi:hypothetical protein
MSNPYFSLKFDLGNIEGIRFYWKGSVIV